MLNESYQCVHLHILGTSFSIQKCIKWTSSNQVFLHTDGLYQAVHKCSDLKQRPEFKFLFSWVVSFKLFNLSKLIEKLMEILIEVYSLHRVIKGTNAYKTLDTVAWHTLSIQFMLLLIFYTKFYKPDMASGLELGWGKPDTKSTKFSSEFHDRVNLFLNFGSQAPFASL